MWNYCASILKLSLKSDIGNTFENKRVIKDWYAYRNCSILFERCGFCLKKEISTWNIKSLKFNLLIYYETLSLSKKWFNNIIFKLIIYLSMYCWFNHIPTYITRTFQSNSSAASTVIQLRSVIAIAKLKAFYLLCTGCSIFAKKKPFINGNSIDLNSKPLKYRHLTECSSFNHATDNNWKLHQKFRQSNLKNH